MGVSPGTVTCEEPPALCRNVRLCCLLGATTEVFGIGRTAPEQDTASQWGSPKRRSLYHHASSLQVAGVEGSACESAPGAHELTQYVGQSQPLR